MTKEQEEIKLLKDFTKMDFSNPMGWTGYYDTELKELSQAIETVLSMIEKRDNQIDLMAKYIACLDNDETICKKLYSGNLCEDKNIVCWECVKQYFERKSEE